MRHLATVLDLALGGALVGALAVSGPFRAGADVTLGRTWQGIGCPHVEAPAHIPRRVSVVPAHHVGKARTVTLDAAWALNRDDAEANDVCVIGHHP